MSNPVLANISENIFNDRYNELSMRDIGIELKHYKMGTAPENPSFVANQDKPKKIIIDKFKDFFQFGLGLEMPILISHIGDGKTHFIRMIFDAYKNIPNIKARRVYLRDEEIDIKIKILEVIDRVDIKKCAEKIISKIPYYNQKKDERLILDLCEKFDIGQNLAKVLLSTHSKELTIQTKAIRILKGSLDEEFLVKLGLENFRDSSEEFYFSFLKLLCEYFRDEGIYIIIVFDEFEHVLDWKDGTKIVRFFRNIKEFTDQMSVYPNLFMMLAATQVYKDKDIFEKFTVIEPAAYDRMKSQFIKLEDISSDEEVLNLVNYLKVRYEKFYSINIDINIVMEILMDNMGNKNIETTYRSYSQEIMRIFDNLRDKYNMEVDSKSENENLNISIEKNKEPERLNTELIVSRDNAIVIWDNTPSPIAKKSLFVVAWSELLIKFGYNILEVDKKYGFIIYKKDGIRNLFYILYTTKSDNPKLFDQKYKEALIIKERNSAEKITFVYPEYLLKDKIGIDYLKSDIKFISYNSESIIELLILKNDELTSEGVKYIYDKYKNMVEL